MRKTIPLNDGWLFSKQCDDDFLCGRKDGEAVQLPHTVALTPFNCFDEHLYQMQSGYRRVIDAQEDWKGKRVFVLFGAVAHKAKVYINGELICEHADGYTAFEVEITRFIKPGEPTVLGVFCDSREDLDQPPFGFVIDYMTYGGMYREVSLEVREKTYISDLFVQPDIPEKQGIVTRENAEEIAELTFRGGVRAQVSVEGQDADGMTLTVLDAAGKVLAEETGSFAPEAAIFVEGARLWDVLSPTLYRLRVTLTKNGEAIDREETTFGFRRARFETDGFYLNGRKLRIRGLNRHQSYPYVGYAMPASQQRLDADILKKELGVNAVRTSHYPQSQHFVGRCDELGLLVFTEIPGWQHIGGENWKKQALENVRSMVTQYRNHPSVILWGVRINESRDDDELYTKTNALAHKLDPTRQTGGVRYLKKSHLLEDVYTYNDFIHSGENRGCEKKKTVTSDPTKPYLVTEYGGHMFPTKSFDDEDHRLSHALRHAAVLDAVAAEEDVAGSFGWCFFDYNTHKDFGSGDRICYHGVCDMFRNPKMAAGVYAANRAGEPFLDVSGSMDIGEHPGGFRGRLFCFTNADGVRVYKNGSFIRQYTHADSPYKHMPCPPIEIDDLIGEQIKNEGFPPKKEKLVRGLLNVYARCAGKKLPLVFYIKTLWAMLRYGMNFGQAYALYGKYLGNWGDASVVYRFEAVKDGKVVKTVEKAPMTKLTLRALPDRKEISVGPTYEVVSVRLRAEDERGNVLPFCGECVKVDIEGPLSLVGPDAAQLRGGMGGAYLRTTGKEGSAKVIFTLPGAEPVTVNFEIIQGEQP